MLIFRHSEHLRSNWIQWKLLIYLPNIKMLFKNQKILYLAINLSQIYIPQMGSGNKWQNQIIQNNWNTVHTSKLLTFSQTRLNSHISSLSYTYFLQKQICYLLILWIQTFTEDGGYHYYCCKWVALHLPAVHSAYCLLVPECGIFIPKEDQIQSATEQTGLCCSSLGPLWNLSLIFLFPDNMAVTWVWINYGLGLMLNLQK